jgi:hypothetical protein
VRNLGGGLCDVRLFTGRSTVLRVSYKHPRASIVVIQDSNPVFFWVNIVSKSITVGVCADTDGRGKKLAFCCSV